MGFESITSHDCTCCDRSGGGGGGCITGTITVCATQACNAAVPGDGTVNQVEGVAITITETFAPFAAFAGTTDATGCFTQSGLGPGVYSVSGAFGTATRTGSVTINSICQPVSASLSFPNGVLGLAVIGCGSVGSPCNDDLAGVSVTVVQSGTTIGTGTTDSLGRVYVNLTRPTDGTNFTITFSFPSHYNDLVISLPGTACFTNVVMNSGFAGVGTHISGGHPIAGYWCCFGPKPLPTVLFATVPGFGSLTLTSTTPGSWDVCVLKAVTGLNFSCTNTAGPITQAYFVGWSCGTLAISTRVCTGGVDSGKPSLIGCANLASTNSSVGSTQTGVTCDPLASTGSFAPGSVFAGVAIGGTWTVTE